MTLKAAAEHIGAGESRMAKPVKEGTLASKGSGISLRVRRSELDAYISEKPAVRATRDRMRQLAAEGLSIVADGSGDGAP